MMSQHSLGSLNSGTVLSFSRCPWLFILLAILVCAGASLGILTLVEETNGSKLWIDSKSDFYQNVQYVSENSKVNNQRRSIILVNVGEGENILTAARIKALYQFRLEVAALEPGANATWHDVCQEIPGGGGALASGGGPGGAGFEPPEWPEVCDLVDLVMATIEMVCLENHVLELWVRGSGIESTETRVAINALTDESVLDTINDPDAKSGITGQSPILDTYLGRVKRDENGRILSAEALIMTLIGKFYGFEELPESEPVMKFEKALINLTLNLDAEGLEATLNTVRSFNDIAGGDIDSDISLLGTGYIIVLIYVMIMLGKFNSVQQRALLSLTGIAAVGMGIGTCYGLCSLIGLDYTGLHSILPFLLLGIGIDDMFVIELARCSQLSDPQSFSERLCRF